MIGIGLDLGSSFTKCALLNTLTGEVTHKASVPTPQRLPGAANAFELDFEQVLCGVKGLIDGALAVCPHPTGIFMSTQMHGYVLSRDGAFVTPYVSWQDTLAASGSAAELEARLGGRIAHMGTRFKAGLALCSLHERLLRGEVCLSGDVLFHTLGGAVLYALSAGSAHVCHLTQAAATGFACADEGRWDGAVIHEAGCEGLRFPRIVSEKEPVGEYLGIPLYADLGDHQCSVLGAAADGHSVVITVGTGGIVCAPGKSLAPVDGVEVRPYFDGGSLLTLTRQPGGRSLDVLVDLFADTLRMMGAERPRQEIWAALWAQADKTEGLRVEPGFHLGSGEGAIDAISARNLTAGNLFYAGLDALSHAYAGCFARLAALQGGLDSVVLCGGRLAKAEGLRQRLQAQVGVPVRASAREDEALYGLLELARRAQGVN
ncbi:MAG: hypothetical protein PHD32_04415 [Eubacteriales bacterium]|nr:hypothetical protein [Eubacteriales bacterium]